MTSPAPRAVIFDLDGTLIDSVIAVTTALNAVLKKHGKRPTHRSAVEKLVSLGAAEILRFTLGEIDLERNVAEFRAIYRAMKPDPGEIFPGTLNMLVALRQRNVKIGICTNKPEDLALHVIRGTGLAAHISATVGGTSALPAKPSPAMIYEVLRRLGVASNDAVYVGDSEIDGEAADAAKLPFYLVSFGYPIGKIDEIPCAGRIDKYEDLPKMLFGDT